MSVHRLDGIYVSVFWYLLVGGAIIYILTIDMFTAMFALGFTLPASVGNVAAAAALVGLVGIIRLVGIFLRSIVIDLCNLVPAVKHLDPRLHKHIGVQHDIFLDGLLHSFHILLKSGLLDAAHGGRGSAEPGVSGHRIGVVKLSPAAAFACISLEIDI